MSLSHPPRPQALLFLLLHMLPIFSCLAFIPLSELRRRGPVSAAAHLRPLMSADADDIEASAESSAAPLAEYTFYDQLELDVRAGSGGSGCTSFLANHRHQRVKADGGSGGRGGDIFLTCDNNMNTFAGIVGNTGARGGGALRANSYGGGGKARRDGPAGGFVARFVAPHGKEGRGIFNQGREGDEVLVRLPVGTIVEELLSEDGEDGSPAKEYTVQVTTLTENYPRIRVARGGDGGVGNGAIKGGKSGARSGAEGGERRRYRLTLKVVADVALVGVPNAGKSTLLAGVTRAKPKIADYPFTTVVPNLGVWGNEYGTDHLVLCDVPGLIAGAADGVGLGHAFLRHVERCHVILHLVDATSSDPLGEFEMINEELVRYGNGKLADMAQVVVVNKIDKWEEEGWDIADEKKQELETRLKSIMGHSRLMWMSAMDGDGVDDLMARMSAFVKKVKDSKAEEAEIKAKEEAEIKAREEAEVEA